MSREVITRQVVVAGAIIDSVSSVAARAVPELRVLNDADGRPIDKVYAHVQPNRRYCVFGDPRLMLAEVDTSIRIEVEAEGYAKAARVVTFGAGELARTSQSISFGNEPVDVAVIGGLPREEDIPLEPLPVSIKGRVSEAENPDTPIAGAQISVTAPSALGPVSSDEDGFFTLGPLPVVAAITLRTTAAGRQTLMRDVNLDFSIPINRASLPLEPS